MIKEINKGKLNKIIGGSYGIICASCGANLDGGEAHRSGCLSVDGEEEI